MKVAANEYMLDGTDCYLEGSQLTIRQGGGAIGTVGSKRGFEDREVSPTSVDDR